MPGMRSREAFIFQNNHGQADVDLLNMMSIDAMCLGNHEFDRGPAFLADMLAQARFPVLAANLDAARDKRLEGLIKPFLVREINGQKIGVIGLVTPETPRISSPGGELFFHDIFMDTRRTIRKLEEMGIDRIIVLSHLGYEHDLALAAKVAGIDLIVGGHSHTVLGNGEIAGIRPQGPYPTRITGPSGAPVLVVQSWEWAKMVGVLDLTFNARGEVASFQGRPALIIGDSLRQKQDDGKYHEVDSEKKTGFVRLVESMPEIEIVSEDPDVLARLSGYRAGLESFREKIVARVDVDLLHVREPGLHPGTGRNLPDGSMIAPLVAEAMLWKVDSQGGSDVSAVIWNAGGVRIDLPRGDLSVGEIYNLLPFEDSLVILELTGAEIRMALEHGVGRGSGAFPYVAGFRYAADASRLAGSRIVRIAVRNKQNDFVPVEDDRSYRVVVNSFLASGGDAYAVFKNASRYRYDTGFTDTEAFIEFAAHVGVLKPLDDSGVEYRK